MRISVVVPVRDGERHLGAALDSLLTQERAPDELLVVDDGSRDGSAALARALPGVRVLELEGRGPAAARNAGVAAATGDAVAFLDADDLADPRRLLLEERVLAGDPAVDGVAAGMENFVSPDCPPEVAARLDFPRGPVPGWHAGTLMLRASALERVGPFDETLRGGEVIDWLHRARAAGLRLELLGEVLLRRRVHGSNITIVQRATLGGGYLDTARAAIARRRALEDAS